MSLPPGLKMHRGKGKWLLRETFKNELPAEIWTRPKMGFGIPIAKWFRTSLKDLTIDALLASDAKCHQFFRPEAIRTLVDEHMQGRANQGYRLWNLLVLELWLRRRDGL